MLKQSRFAWCCAWLTALAMLLSAVLPALSQANQSGSSNLLTVCTTTGLKWLDTTSGELLDENSQAGQALMLEHCDWCSAQPLDLTPFETTSPVLSLLYLAPRPVARPLPAQPFVWSTAKPRAPPSVA